MANDPTPWQPLTEILEQRLSTNPGLKAKQERLLQKLASEGVPATQPDQWTPEQEHEDGKFRRARVLQRIAAAKAKTPGTPE